VAAFVIGAGNAKSRLCVSGRTSKRARTVEPFTFTCKGFPSQEEEAGNHGQLHCDRETGRYRAARALRDAIATDRSISANPLYKPTADDSLEGDDSGMVSVCRCATNFAGGLFVTEQSSTERFMLMNK
jgi:hypothetical protein